MPNGMTIFVGTIGQGVMHSTDSGGTWDRVRLRRGLHSDALVRCLAVHPKQPNIVFAGSDRGLYRTDDAGATWEKISSPLDDYYTWSLAIDPVEPDVMFAGTGTPTPAGIFRSTDGGKSWERRPVQVAATCSAVGVPRVTAIAIDPIGRKNIWVGLEVDGVRVSTDRGDTWNTASVEVNQGDVHNIVVCPGPPKTVIVVGNRDIHTSTDDGATWRALGLQQNLPWKSPAPQIYLRGIAVKPGQTQTIFLGVGDFTPGNVGAVLRSKDLAKSWETLALPSKPNSSMWTFGTHQADGNVIFAGSRFGYLYRSDNGGDSWTKLEREFSEIAAVRWIPN
ncbi:MAG: WD40/YVTN/BNR-like repeat-containing protein [Candidatus Binatia bacterium]